MVRCACKGDTPHWAEGRLQERGCELARARAVQTELWRRVWQIGWSSTTPCCRVVRSVMGLGSAVERWQQGGQLSVETVEACWSPQDSEAAVGQRRLGLGNSWRAVGARRGQQACCPAHECECRTKQSPPAEAYQP